MNEPAGFKGTPKGHVKIKHWLTKAKKAFKKGHIADAISNDKETPLWKKVVSLTSLALGVIMLATGPVIALAAGAIVTGIIALQNNHSNKHRLMAIAGIVLGVSAIGAVYLVASLF
jgi:hypothetical protein